MPIVPQIEQSLAAMKLGAPQVHLNLALFPLLDERTVVPDYVLLDEALERKLAEVTEVSAEGRVPELAFENTCDEKVLLVDGDELVGAKQNRVLNLTILVRGRKKLTIPVSCVEQGRWTYRSSRFGAAGGMLFAKARMAKMRDVTHSLAGDGSRRTNQGEIWKSVADKVAFSAADSPTLAMSDAYEEAAAKLKTYTSAFRGAANQRGAVVAIDGKPVGVELFDSQATFAGYLERIIRSYALDAMETAGSASCVPTADDARRFLERVATASGERFSALGEGEDVRLTGEGIAGAALMADDRIIHLAGFAVPQAVIMTIEEDPCSDGNSS